MQGRTFELQVADLLRGKGYRVEHDVRVCGSQTDVVAFGHDECILVECKDWQSGAGIGVARDLSGRVQEARLSGDARFQFATGLLVSAQPASRGARSHAQAVNYLRCVTIDELRLAPTPLFDLLIEVFRPYLVTLSFQYQHWDDFNESGPTGTTSKRPMMIPKMAAVDLLRRYVPLTCRAVKQYAAFGTARGRTISAREAFMLKLITAGWSAWRGSHDGIGLKDGPIDALLDSWSSTHEKLGAPRVLVVLGDYGTGKSSAALHFTCELATHTLRQPTLTAAVPLYIDLQDFRRVGRIEAFLQERLKRNYSTTVDDTLIERLLATGRIIVIFDGFDEMSSRGSVSDTLENLREIKRIATSGIKCLLTARTHYFRSLTETQQVMRGQALATVNAAVLYDAYTAQWIEHDDWRSNMTAEGKHRFMLHLSWVTFEKGMAKIDLPEVMKSLPVAPRDLLKPSSATNGLVEDRIDYDLRTCTFVRRDSEGHYSFSHRSLQEFFCARYLIANLDQSSPELVSRHLCTYSTRIHWDWPSEEIVSFMLDMARGNPRVRQALLGLTAGDGFGGNGATLVCETGSLISPEEDVGRNLRGCAGFRVDFSGRDLCGADLSQCALASPSLMGTNLARTAWQDAAIRINQIYSTAFFSPDTLAVASSNSTLSVCNLATGRRRRCFINQSEYVHGMAIHPERGLYAASTWNDVIFVFRTTDGSQISRMEGEGAGGGRVAFSADGSLLAAGSWDGVVAVWEANPPNRRVGTWELSFPIHDLQFSPGGETLAAAGRNQIALISTKSLGDVPKPIELSDWMSVESLAFSPDGKHLAFGLWQNDPVTIYDIANGQAVQVPDTGLFSVFALAFSPDGASIAAGGRKGTVIMDLKESRVRKLSDLDDRDVKSLAFSDDGARLVSGGLDGAARIWRLETGELVAVVDVAIQCLGANVEHADFGSESVRMRPESEEWWAGPALRDRMIRCGAVENHRDPKCVWTGREYNRWRESLAWRYDSWSTWGSTTDRLSRPFAGVASMNVYSGGPQKRLSNGVTGGAWSVPG